MAMEHRQFYKMSPYESSVRVPLIVAGPGVRHNAQVELPVNLVDIYPTLMDMAGAPHPEDLDGHSLMPELSGQDISRPGWAFSEYHDTSCNTGVFMLRRRNWKYIVYVGYEPQLFNLREDPDEIIDLSRDRPDMVEQMDGLLRQIVDYEAVDVKVKAYDRESFVQWRREQTEAGTYEETMARIFSGWDDLTDDAVQPWTEADERTIQDWIES